MDVQLLHSTAYPSLKVVCEMHLSRHAHRAYEQDDILTIFLKHNNENNGHFSKMIKIRCFDSRFCAVAQPNSLEQCVGSKWFSWDEKNTDKKTAKRVFKQYAIRWRSSMPINRPVFGSAQSILSKKTATYRSRASPNATAIESRELGGVKLWETKNSRLNSVTLGSHNFATAGPIGSILRGGSSAWSGL